MNNMKKQSELFKSEEQQGEYLKNYDTGLEQIGISFSTQYIETTYGATHIIQCGDINNPKLLMLHCMGFTSISWYNNLKSLSEKFNVYCVDSIGEPGKTISYKSQITIDEYNEWLLEIVSALKVDKINLAGWSFGGFLATSFVMRYPEKVEKVIVMSPAATVAPLSPMFYLKLLPALFSGKDKKINQFLKWICENDNLDYPNPAFSVFSSGMKNFKGWATGTKLVVYSDNDFISITRPYLLLIGSNDPIYKKQIHTQIVDKFNKINPNIRAEVISGTHGFPIQQSEIVNQKIISYLL